MFYRIFLEAVQPSTGRGRHGKLREYQNWITFGGVPIHSSSFHSNHPSVLLQRSLVLVLHQPQDSLFMYGQQWLVMSSYALFPGKVMHFLNFTLVRNCISIVQAWAKFPNTVKLTSFSSSVKTCELQGKCIA